MTEGVDPFAFTIMVAEVVGPKPGREVRLLLNFGVAAMLEVLARERAEEKAEETFERAAATLSGEETLAALGHQPPTEDQTLHDYLRGG